MSELSSLIRGVVLLALAQGALAETEAIADPLRPIPSGPSQIIPADAIGPALSRPRLTMIMRNARQHYAVIDGLPRRVGEWVSGYRLLAIHPASVLLEGEGGQTLELGLLSGNVIKKPVSRPAEGSLRP